MTESLSQGIPSLKLNDKGVSLYKSNDISFANLKKAGFNCLSTSKKPDQFVAFGQTILIGIEEKRDSTELDAAIRQIKDNYLDALPETKYFIARAGERTKVFYRLAQQQIIETGTTLKGKEVICFGPKVITGENLEISQHLNLLAEQVLSAKEPVNGSLEIQPPKEYYNPLVVKQTTIFNLWQKIFVCTGENAHICLSTFVELLLYKGISDAKLLTSDFSIEHLASPNRSNALETYKNSVRNYIKTKIFPTISDQPGVINGFAFDEQETVFKSVLTDLCELGNLAQRQIDPDFKRRVIEAFLGSAHKEGTIKNGKHLTPRTLIQAIWEMADPKESARIVDPACGVGGFVLEGLNYPYEFDPLQYNCVGIDRDEQMIITSKANMILHILDKLADPQLTKINKKKLIEKINTSFLQAKNNGTGTLGELHSISQGTSQFMTSHPADYVFANVPFYVNGIAQIDNSLEDNGIYGFYKSCGIGVESRFLKYILSQIQNGNPGMAFVIITDGVLYRHKDHIRDVINQYADVLGIISLPPGCFQNNNWKTSILIFQKKAEENYLPVFLYNVRHIGISLDAYRTPTEENDIPSLKRAWKRRYSRNIDDPNCHIISREIFLQTKRWSDLFDWCKIKDTTQNISFSEFIESAEEVTLDITILLKDADKNLGDIFALEQYVEVELGDIRYFKTGVPQFKTTIKHARLNPGKYPLFSSQVEGAVEFMGDRFHQPLLIENETQGKTDKLISWNIKGDPCKDIRLHEEPFYVTENRGLIEIIYPQIDLYYVLYYLREHLAQLGKFSRSDEAHAGKVKALHIKIPINEKGEFDIDKQQLIAKNYEQVIELRNTMQSKINELKDLIKNIDIFK